MTPKGFARKHALKDRENLSKEMEEAIDKHIAFNVINCSAYRKADTIFTYYSVDGEVCTRSIIVDAINKGRTVCIPKCAEGRKLDWFQIQSLNDVEVGRFGLLEPIAGLKPARPSGAKSIALVPALVFDKHGNRLGYGKGYFDEFLASFSGISIGLCREMNLKDDLFKMSLMEDHDLPVQIVITENEMYLT